MLTLLLPILLAAAAGPPRTFTVDPARSAVRVHVGKSGAFSFAGHTHEVTGPVKGTVTVDEEDATRSSVELSFAPGALTVLAEGEPSGDAPKVQEIMRGPRVLDAERYPAITFRSREVTVASHASSSWQLRVAGDLTLHGVTHPAVIPVKVTLDGHGLTASAQATVKQSAYGIEPVSAGGGTVKVKDELSLDFTVVAANP